LLKELVVAEYGIRAGISLFEEWFTFATICHGTGKETEISLRSDASIGSLVIIVEGDCFRPWESV
jgi:hypothetical protein